MQDISLIISVALIHLLALMSPGPDFLMTVRNSLTYSRRTGIFTAIGLSIGISVHILYCIAGLALIISKSIIAFNAIKLFGAAYLIYIGIKSVIAKKSTINIKEEKKRDDITRLKAIKIGFLTNVLNPKATIFFLSLFTFVIKPETPTVTLSIISVLMITLTALWFSLVAIFFTQKHILKIFNKFEGVFNKTFGGLLILLGIKIAISENY